MRKWDLTLVLEPASGLPLFLQLASAVANDIRRGRLKPGDALPSTRALAERLGVHRNTVIAGYRELIAEGLAHARWGGGTYVADPPAATLAPVPRPIEEPSYTLAAPLPLPPPARVPPGMLMLYRALPDVRLLPAEALARAFRRAVSRHGRKLLSYGDARGHVSLRHELAIMLTRTRGLSASVDNVLITHGSQQAIDVVARALVSPGDVVAVEELGNPSTWNVLRLAGAVIEPLPVDAEGLDVEAFAALLKQKRVRAVHVTPHHQFPTNGVMSAARRARLAQLALRHRVAVIEDDYDHEFHYEGKPILPIAAGSGRANVIYVGSLSKVLAPGLRCGFIVAPPMVLERLVSVRIACDLQGDTTLECAIAELFEDGEVDRHVRRMRNIYGRRRDALAAALERHLGGALGFRVPDGGMALWARVDDAIDVQAWVRASERHGVLLCGARVHDVQGREQPFLRLGFTYHDEDELADAARRMARALKSLSR